MHQRTPRRHKLPTLPIFNFVKAHLTLTGQRYWITSPVKRGIKTE